jgi:hypothetical protein
VLRQAKSPASEVPGGRRDDEMGRGELELGEEGRTARVKRRGRERATDGVMSSAL